METIDILLIVLAFCALWITAFICWFVYQLAVMLKRVNDVISEIKTQAQKIERALGVLEEKFEAGTGHLAKLADHVKKYFHESNS